MFIIALLVTGGIGTVTAWTGVCWTQATKDAGFDARIDHTSVAFKDRLWVIGGVDTEGIYFNDVWSSLNGESWTQIPVTDPFPARSFHSSVVFQDKMWVIGGDSGSIETPHYFNDVWYSSDGISWTQATSDATFEPRTYLTSVVFDNKMWVIGGSDINGNYYNDVWYSTNGASWTRVTDNAAFSKRTYHSSVVFDNKMWVIGGDDGTPPFLNDVWYSTDGIAWTQAVEHAGFEDRVYHTSEVFDNKMWLIGGGGNDENIYYNDAWYSGDGVKWLLAKPTASHGQQILEERSYHSSVVLANKIWVIGGDSGKIIDDKPKYFNDAWYLVVESNEKPDLKNPGPKKVAEGTTLTIALTAEDDDEELTYTFTSTGQLDGATIDGNKFTWTPGPDTAGTYTVTFRVTDPDGAFDEETITITVTKCPVKIPVKIKIVPDPLNLGCKGGVFVVFVQLPKEYTANEVSLKSITCGGAPAERLIKSRCFPHSFGVIFSRNKLQNIPPGDTITLTLTGQLKHAGQVVDFEGSDTVRVINKYTKNKEDIDSVRTLSDDKIFEKHFRPSQFFNHRK